VQHWLHECHQSKTGTITIPGGKARLERAARHHRLHPDVPLSAAGGIMASLSAVAGDAGCGLSVISPSELATRQRLTKTLALRAYPVAGPEARDGPIMSMVGK
jgi:hypothetical protein